MANDAREAVSPKKSEVRRGQIIRAAERVFAKQGFQEATISHVAKEAAVSDATIYEYFSSKEELLFSIPGETAGRTVQNLRHILAHMLDPADKIHGIIYSYLMFYENHPDYASIAMLILKQNRKFLDTPVYEDIRRLSRIIIEVLEEGISSGRFRADIDVYLIRSLILGTIEHNVIRWLLLGKPEKLSKLAKPLTDLVLGGIKEKDKGRSWNLRVILDQDDTEQTAGASPKKTGDKR